MPAGLLVGAIGAWERGRRGTRGKFVGSWASAVSWSGMVVCVVCGGGGSVVMARVGRLGGLINKAGGVRKKGAGWGPGGGSLRGAGVAAVNSMR